MSRRVGSLSALNSISTQKRIARLPTIPLLRKINLERKPSQNKFGVDFFNIRGSSFCAQKLEPRIEFTEGHRVPQRGNGGQAGDE